MDVDGSAAAAPPAGVLRLMAAMTVAITGFGVVNLTLIAWGHGRGTPALGGVVSAVWSAGSVLGGLAAVARPPGAVPLGRRLALVTAGIAPLALVLPPWGSGNPWTVALVLAAGGTVIPMALAAMYDRLAGCAPPSRRAELFGWLATATTTVACLTAAALAGGLPGPVDARP